MLDVIARVLGLVLTGAYIGLSAIQVVNSTYS